MSRKPQMQGGAVHSPRESPSMYCLDGVVAVVGTVKVLCLLIYLL